MAAGDIRAGRAFVEVTMKDSALMKGLNNVSARLKAFGAGVSSIGTKLFAIGAVAGAGILGAVKIFASLGDTIDETSQKLGISTESFSALSFAAEQTGGSVEGLSAAFKKMAATVSAGAKGNEAAAEAFEDIGLNAAKLASLSPDQQFIEIADALAQIPNITQRTAAALKVFGKGAQELLPLLSQGRAGIEEFYKEAQRLGIVMDGETAAAAGKLNDSLDALKTQFKFLVANVGGTLAPIFTGIAEAMKTWGKATIDFVKANAGLFRILALVVAGVVAFSGAMLVLGPAISAVGSVLGLLGTAIGFIASPLGVAVVAATTLAYLFFTMTDAGKQLASTLIAAFQEFAGEVTTSFGAVSNAISAGNFAAAWKVVTTLMTLEWTKFIGYLQTTWAGWKAYFLNMWSDASASFAIVLSEAFATAQAGWTETVAFFQTGWVLIQKGWDEFVAVAKLAWTRLYTWIAEGIAYILEQLGLVEEGTVQTIKEMAKDKAGKIMEQREKDQAGRNEQLGNIETQREKERAKIKEDMAGREKAILDQNEFEKSKNNDGTAKAEEDAAEAIRKAREEWEKAVNDANAITNPNAQKGKDAGAAAFDGIDESAKTDKAARGTFSAAALQALAGADNTTQDKILKESQKQRELQAELVKLQRRNSRQTVAFTA